MTSLVEGGSSRQQNTMITRQTILDAAEELFTSHGYADTALSEIAKRSGVTKSLIHHHFHSKAALWSEVRGRLWAEHLSAQASVLHDRDSDPTRLLEGSIRAYFRFLQQRPHLVRMIGWTLLEDDPSCKWVDVEFNQQLVEIFNEAQHAGKVRSDLDGACFIAQMLSMVVHYFECKPEVAHMMTGDRHAETDDTYLENMLRLVRHGAFVDPVS
ncbi:MAG: TetR/AcrR family transcriptional regulator [Deltaproteobacteria bacterium]|nr:TetR/AcrR family transcriptional regulator [Deltaproteobacteria bacterium]